MTPEELAGAFRWQAGWSDRLGSGLYRVLLSRVAEDIASSGRFWALLRDCDSQPVRSFPLRFLAAVHRLVLEGRLPGLAEYYPSVGGAREGDGCWPAFVTAIEEYGGTIVERLPRTVQTNEVRRSRALLPGFLEVARRSGAPLRLLEIGCSAGLNLRWDRFRYETARGAWGDEASPVLLPDAFEGEAPDLNVEVSVVERRGCDLDPIDPTSDEGRMSLLSFVWPDQLERLKMLSGALEAARDTPAEVDQADAAEWLATQLAEERAGLATVVFHSTTFPYIDSEGRERLGEICREAGERACEESPVARLEMEPGEDQADVVLTMWPGGERRLIARASFHGDRVRVLAR